MKLMRLIYIGCMAAVVFFIQPAQLKAQDHSIAREWNEILLEGIRNDFARPTVHARNLWHSSILMYDIWALFDESAEPYFLGQTVGGFTCPFDGFNYTGDKEEVIEEAISYAMYRLMQNRFQNSPGAGFIFSLLNDKMISLGFDTSNNSIDYSTGDPAALGNYIGQQMIAFGLQDGSRQQNNYSNEFYTPVNDPLVVKFPGAGMMNDPNRWQPLTLDVFIDQSGNEIPFNTPPFLSPEWGTCTPFALTDDDLTIYTKNGNEYWVYHDPGLPPQVSLTEKNEMSELFKWGFTLVSIWSSHLDPADGVMIDISPANQGNLPVSEIPTDFADYPDFYDLFNGGVNSPGHDINPYTGEPYEPNIVARGDYTRVLAEFWADGPASETPPGHWFTILNYVNDHPAHERRYRGQGEELDPLEWDVKSYFMLGSAMHDCAVTAWGIKGWYDYLRPISAIRSMADRGQSTDENLPNYHPGGAPLIPGYVELVTETDPLVGDNNEHLNKIKLYTWNGPNAIDDPETDVAGVGWILAENWWPYQRPSFVSPPFAGYISGHSTFSRAAAETLTFITGSKFFPGGMGVFDAGKNEFLVFEEGPSENMELQWATYQDASDQTSLSRIWGGIHPPQDDIPGRLIGIEIAEDVTTLAETYFFKDEDQDGYYDYVDCDDLDASIHPGAGEICDGIDNNCSGEVDEGLAQFTYYQDVDNDGFGDLAFPMDTCLSTAPVGFVDNAADCNDIDMEINPSVQEVCDGIDNDCNGSVDDGLPVTTYYLDSDGDGFGDQMVTLDTCLVTPPSNYVANNFDCDDANSSIHPDMPEICDAIDNDCNGLLNDGLVYNRYFFDFDGDGYGEAMSFIDTCLQTAPPGYVIDSTDCNDEVAGINPGATEIPDNDIDEDCSGLDLFEATKIFPNPVTDMLNVHYDYNSLTNIKLFSVDGRIVNDYFITIQDNNFQIDLSALASGVYILRLEDGNAEELITQSIVKI